MSRRIPHGTYAEESSFFITTLNSLIHILEQNDKAGREIAINSLSNLLSRLQRLRLAGQINFNHAVPTWTKQCNKLHDRILRWHEELSEVPSSAPRVAAEIGMFQMFAHNPDPEHIDQYISMWESEDPRRGDRSGAPSPEPAMQQLRRAERSRAPSPEPVPIPHVPGLRIRRARRSRAPSPEPVPSKNSHRHVRIHAPASVLRGARR